MIKRASTRDIAAAADVSQATVSYILSGRSDKVISDTTRARVLQKATEMRYRPNRLVTSVFRGYTQTIGVLMPDSDLSFFSRIMAGIQHACAAGDFAVLLSYTERNSAQEERDIERLLEHRVTGILYIETGMSLAEPHPWLEPIIADNIPVTIMDDVSNANKAECIVSDDFQGAQMAVSHLISLGHRHIAHVSSSCSTSSVLLRRDGYSDAMRRAGLEAYDRFYDFYTDYSQIARDVQSMLKEPNAPTAIFAGTDPFAKFVIDALEYLGLRVPQDVAVVGYSDTELSEGLRLTTVHQDAEQMGFIAADRLLRRAKGENLPNEIIRLPTNVVVRRSCGTYRKELSRR